MNLSRKSELAAGSSEYLVSTELAGDAAPVIETVVRTKKGDEVFRTNQDISELRPIFQNSKEIFTRLDAQHKSVITKLQQGEIGAPPVATLPTSQTNPDFTDEASALDRAVSLLGAKDFPRATSQLRSIVDGHPNCSEARELLDVAYGANSGTSAAQDIGTTLKKGTEAFMKGNQRDAIESWKACLVKEPDNRPLQLLVLLSTTWSADRRNGYAQEILSPASNLLGSSRPEETQALLMVAQTVDGGAAPAPAPEHVAPPVPEPEPTPTIATTAPPPAASGQPQKDLLEFAGLETESSFPEPDQTLSFEQRLADELDDQTEVIPAGSLPFETESSLPEPEQTLSPEERLADELDDQTEVIPAGSLPFTTEPAEEISASSPAPLPASTPTKIFEEPSKPLSAPSVQELASEPPLKPTRAPPQRGAGPKRPMGRARQEIRGSTSVAQRLSSSFWPLSALSSCCLEDRRFRPTGWTRQRAW